MYIYFRTARYFSQNILHKKGVAIGVIKKSFLYPVITDGKSQKKVACWGKISSGN